MGALKTEKLQQACGTQKGVGRRPRLCLARGAGRQQSHALHSAREVVSHSNTIAIGVSLLDTFVTVTLWPSGLRRWLKAPFRKGVGSNPTGVIFQCRWRNLRRSSPLVAFGILFIAKGTCNRIFQRG